VKEARQHCSIWLLVKILGLVQFRNSASQHIALFIIFLKEGAKSCLSLRVIWGLVRCQVF